MNVTFGKDFIKAEKNGNIVLDFTLNQLKEDKENNFLFRLLEACVRNGELTFEIQEEVSPYIAKLYDILCDEFDLEEYDV